MFSVGAFPVSFSVEGSNFRLESLVSVRMLIATAGSVLVARTLLRETSREFMFDRVMLGRMEDTNG